MPKAEDRPQYVAAQVCPTCKGKGVATCKTCAGHGRLSAPVAVQLNRAAKAASLKRKAAKGTRPVWNKGKIIGQRAPLTAREVWALRSGLAISANYRDLALFNLGLDSGLVGCDLVKLRVQDVFAAGRALNKAEFIRWNGRTSSFCIGCECAISIERYLSPGKLKPTDYLFPGRAGRHLNVRQYGRIAEKWGEILGKAPGDMTTESIRRTRAALMYWKTGNLRAVQLFLDHACAKTTVNYLGIDNDDGLDVQSALEMADNLGI